MSPMGFCAQRAFGASSRAGDPSSPGAKGVRTDEEGVQVDVFSLVEFTPKKGRAVTSPDPPCNASPSSSVHTDSSRLGPQLSPRCLQPPCLHPPSLQPPSLHPPSLQPPCLRIPAPCNTASQRQDQEEAQTGHGHPCCPPGISHASHACPGNSFQKKSCSCFPWTIEVIWT